LRTSETIAFIDEFGTNSFAFDKPDVSTHFIITCIIVEKTNEERIKGELEKIRKIHFQQSEIKSSNVGGDDKRRLKILSEIVTSEFQILALVIDKRKLEGEGFGYKPSFYKFLNSLVYDDLDKVFADIDVTMDEHGHEKFMNGFIKYIRKKHDLFSPLYEIKFEDSKINVIIQLADFISGTFARVYDETKKSPLGDNFLKVLKHRIGNIKFFPASYDRFTYEYSHSDRIVDPQVDELALRRANDFINRFEGDLDSSRKLQVKTLKLLRLFRQTIGYSRYIPTKEILEHLNYGRIEPVTEYYFRTNIIAKLRDKEVLIASSKNGYKLPVSKSDLYDFLNHGSTVVIPLLQRMRKCIEMIKLATGTDITDKENYKELRQILQIKDE
jgi:hypothetical protein